MTLRPSFIGKPERKLEPRTFVDADVECDVDSKADARRTMAPSGSESARKLALCDSQVVAALAAPR